MSRISKVAVALLLGSTALSTAQAATLAQADPAPADTSVAQTADTTSGGDEIIVTGTREVGTKAADAAAPIQLLSQEALTHVGQPNLNQALTQIVPSFTAQTQGTDMASFSLSARLRGVSPNHTLVMVNGKRRHGNSILQVINGAFGGSAAPSIDLIPPDAVQRIEILQDGAAAQYGSDAIAGVINIILKSNDSGVSAKASVGEYYDGEGRTYSASGNFGLPVGESGFLSVTLFQRSNDYTKTGDGQFTVKNLNGSRNTTVAGGFVPIYDSIIARNADANINGGQPKSKLYVAMYNFGYDFGGIEFYSFGDLSYRHGDALQGYRPANRICSSSSLPSTCLQSTITNGLVPHIEVKQDEFSLTNGFRGEVGDGWNWDLSGTYAEDVSKVYTTGSANASLFTNTFNAGRNAAYCAANSCVGLTAAQIATLANVQPYIAAGQAVATTPSYFYDGSFKFTQFVGTLDVRKELDVGMATPLTFAFGGEYRKETYAITAGDDASRYVEGGQSFPGYALSDASSLKRNAEAGYIDLSVKPVDGWLVDLAGRFEHYSDFGNTVIGKITTRYDFSEAFALRATASTGFRAPALQESGYSSTNVGPTSATLQLAPSSPGAAAAGFGALKPEKSTNFSAGVVLRPVPKLVVTLDGYYIKIRDRIVSSGTITGQDAAPFPTPGVRRTNIINGITAYQLVQNAIAASGKALDPTVLQSGSLAIQTFTNGIDTRTVGAELSMRYPVELSFGKLDLSLGANYNDTKVTKSRLGALFNLQSEAIIEQSSPKFKAVLGGLFSSGGFTLNTRATYYSKTVALVQPNAFSTTARPITGDGTAGYYEGIVKAAVIVDLEAGYDLTKFLNIAVGANNLFNKKPEIPALVADYNAANPAAGWLAGRSPYVNNGGSINGPYNHGPYGTNGGYYYARLSLNF
ncbi:MAG: TonB-dependent receptor [Sphingomonadales bacterium]|nr:TonB-dependent receptor [Sphingomonadales bacterium]